MSKDTLFVWDGIMEANEEDIVWYGTVHANENAPDATKVQEPQRNAFKEFCDSTDQFRVTGKAHPVDGVKDNDKYKPFHMNLIGGEGWDCSGSKNQDKEHELLLASLLWRGSSDKRDCLVFARGSDASGPFIAAGWMRPGNRITLARRYVDASNDPRAKWTTDNVREEVLKQIYDEQNDEIQMPPWQCVALSVSGDNQ